MEEILKSTVGSKGRSGTDPVLVVDLHTRTCDTARAFANLRSSWPIKTFYWGLTDTGRADAVPEEAWAMEHMSLWMTNEFMAGNLSIPGSELPEQAVDAEAHGLEKPPLTICTWADAEVRGQPPSIVVPESVVNAWSTHEKYGEEFKKFTAECSHLKGQVGRATRGIKRRSSDTVPMDVKRMKNELHIAGARALEAADPVPAVQPLVKDIALSIDGLFVRCLPGPEIEIVSHKDEDHVFPAGFVLLGFHGAGSWRQGKTPEDQAARENEIPFVLQDANSSVILDGGLSVLGDVVETQLAKDPMATIKYFKMIPEPRDGWPGWFKLEQRHHLFWKMANYSVSEEKAIKPMSAGSLLPVATYMTEHTEVVWQVRWTSHGLTPSVPCVIVKHNLQVAKKSTVKLAKA